MTEKTKPNGKKRQSPSVERQLALALVALLEDISLVHVGEVVSATEQSDRAAREVLKANGYEDLESIPTRVKRIEAEIAEALKAQDGAKLAQLGAALDRAKKGLPPLVTEKKSRKPRKPKEPESAKDNKPPRRKGKPDDASDEQPEGSSRKCASCGWVGVQLHPEPCPDCGSGTEAK